MRFVHLIEGKKAEELYKLNAGGTGGYFPIGLNNAWHGGIHFDGKHTLVAIADGEIVAYRFSNEYSEYTKDGKQYRYSNCLVLIKHTYTTPNGASLTFFAHYINCASYNRYDEAQKKKAPVFKQKKGYKILTKGLSVRKTASVEDDNLIRRFEGGEKVLATAADESWAKIEGKDEYFAFNYDGKKHAEGALIDQEPEYDKVVTCKIPVKAGDVVGYSGVFERPSVGVDHCHVHIEIFSADNVPAFIANPKGDGKKKPTALKVAEGAVLRTREKRFTDEQVKSTVTVGKGSNLKVLDSSDSEYLHVREHEMTRVLPHSFLKWQAATKNYCLAWENAAEASKIFDGYLFEKEDTFSFIGYADKDGNKVGKDGDPPNRIVKFVCDEESAERFWVKRSDVGEIKNDTVEPKADLNTVFRQNPNAIKFEKEAGTVTAESFCPIEECESAKDDKGALWYKVKAEGAEGWIAENDPKLEMQSAFDWQGFKVIKEEGDNAYDMLIDYKRVSPFFQKIFDEIDTSKDQKISQEEMQKALKDEKTSGKLSKLICYHPSEWWVDSGFSYWQSVFMRSSAEQKALLEEQLKNLCWWDEVATKSNDLPLAPNVYHFHPVAFVEQMRLLDNKPEWLVFAEEEARRWAGKTEVEISKTINYHKEVGINLSDMVGTDHAWCASFVNYCIKQANYPTFSPACRAKAVQFDNNFVKINDPIFGCIGLVGTHHVGFVYALNEGNKRPIMLGGNQSDQINFTAWGGALSYYIPKGFNVPKGNGSKLPTATAAQLNEEFGILLNKKDGDITR